MTRVAIVGGGIAGLSAGICAALNGFETHIFEKHSIAGGLCTAWDRKGHVIDGCVHWLVGSKPGNSMHRIWEDLGALDGVKFVDQDEYVTIVQPDGRRLAFPCNMDRMYEEFGKISPEDRHLLDEFRRAVNKARGIDLGPDIGDPWWKRSLAVLALLGIMPMFMRYDRVSVGDFAKRFKSRELGLAFEHFFLPEMPMIFMIMSFAWFMDKNAGYPLGGSRVLVDGMVKKFESLGGKLHRRAPVKRIEQRDGRAVGLVLEDGSEVAADWVISGADLHATLNDLLDPPAPDQRLQSLFETNPPFEPLAMVAFSMPRFPEGVPLGVAGSVLRLDKPLDSGGKQVEGFSFHPFSVDPTLAPEGRTVGLAMVEAGWEYWNDLKDRKDEYQARKAELASQVQALLEQRFPSLRGNLELLDVSTPWTFRRYTGNWRGSYEGFLANKDNYRKPSPLTVQGVDRLLLCGHWLRNGGGLPTAAMTGMEAVLLLCKREGRPFKRR
jgi:phytoene dehydrogenase-like protein